MSEETARVTLRLPERLHRHLQELAATSRRSLNSEIIWRLETALNLPPERTARPSGMKANLGWLKQAATPPSEPTTYVHVKRPASEPSPRTVVFPTERVETPTHQYVLQTEPSSEDGLPVFDAEPDAPERP